MNILIAKYLFYSKDCVISLYYGALPLNLSTNRATSSPLSASCYSSKNGLCLDTSSVIRRTWVKHKGSVKYITKLVIYVLGERGCKNVQWKQLTRICLGAASNRHLIYALRMSAHIMKNMACTVDSLELFSDENRKLNPNSWCNPPHPLLMVAKLIELILLDPSSQRLSVRGWVLAKSLLFLLRTPHTAATLVGATKALLKKSTFKNNSKELKKSSTCVSSLDPIQFGNKYQIMHHFFPLHKRLIGILLNNWITSKHVHAINNTKLELLHQVNPDSNFCRRVALQHLFMSALCNVETADIVALMRHFSDFVTTGRPTSAVFEQSVTRQPPQATDADLLNVMQMLYTAGSARCKVKILQVNLPHCLCYVKCTGYPRNLLMERMFTDEQMPLHFGLRICGLCRLAHGVENTTANKPKRVVVPENIDSQTCSLDGCGDMRHVPLYHVRIEKGGSIVQYSHNFYTTNSGNVTDELFRPDQQRISASGRLYGVCYSGSRRCFKKVTDIIPSGSRKKSKITSSPPFSCVEYWWRCTNCRDVPSYDVLNHRGILEHIHRDTCLYEVGESIYKRVTTASCRSEVDFTHVYSAVREAMSSVCTGCIIAISCKHFLVGLFNVNTPVSPIKLMIAQQMRFLAQTELGVRWKQQQQQKGH